jgi:hypothetical protein
VLRFYHFSSYLEVQQLIPWKERAMHTWSLFFFFSLHLLVTFLFYQESEYIVVISFVNGELVFFFFFFSFFKCSEVTFTSYYSLSKETSY